MCCGHTYMYLCRGTCSCSKGPFWRYLFLDKQSVAKHLQKKLYLIFLSLRFMVLQLCSCNTMRACFCIDSIAFARIFIITGAPNSEWALSIYASFLISIIFAYGVRRKAWSSGGITLNRASLNQSSLYFPGLTPRTKTGHEHDATRIAYFSVSTWHTHIDFFKIRAGTLGSLCLGRVVTYQLPV